MGRYDQLNQSIQKNIQISPMEVAGPRLSFGYKLVETMSVGPQNSWPLCNAQFNSSAGRVCVQPYLWFRECFPPASCSLATACGSCKCGNLEAIHPLTQGITMAPSLPAISPSLLLAGITPMNDFLLLLFSFNNDKLHHYYRLLGGHCLSLIYVSPELFHVLQDPDPETTCPRPLKSACASTPSPSPPSGSVTSNNNVK